MRAKGAGGGAEEVGSWGRGEGWGRGGSHWPESGGGGRRAELGEPAGLESSLEEMAAGRGPAAALPTNVA